MVKLTQKQFREQLEIASKYWESLPQWRKDLIEACMNNSGTRDTPREKVINFTEDEMECW